MSKLAQELYPKLDQETAEKELLKQIIQGTKIWQEKNNKQFDVIPAEELFNFLGPNTEELFQKHFAPLLLP